MIQKVCPYCLQEVLPDSTRCPVCGASLNGEKDESYKREYEIAAEGPGTGLADGVPKSAPPADKRLQEIVDAKTTDMMNELAEKYADFISGEDALSMGLSLSLAGGGKNAATALKLFKIAAVNGAAKAWYQIAYCYENGLGAEKDSDLAKYFYMQGAEKDERCVNTLKLRFNTQLGAASAAAGGDFVRLVELLKTNVVQVNAYVSGSNTGQCGGGGIISGDLVTTNAHVILDGNNRVCDKIYVTVGDEPKRYDVAVEKYNAAEDIAICRFTGEKPPAKYGERLQLRSAKTVKAGEDVFTIGNPQGLGLNVSKGIISKELSLYGSRQVLRSDMTANHGNSGGPLFDIQGNMLGMITFHIFDSSDGSKVGDMSFSVVSDTIQKVLLS